MSQESKNITVEKLAVETSEALVVAMDTLRVEYEKKIEEYEKQVNEDQLIIEELTNENKNNNRLDNCSISTTVISHFFF